MAKKKHLKTIGALAVLSCFFGIIAPAANAEGSRDLASSGGDRPYLEFRTDSSGGIPRRTIMKVYANQGETIDLGSSAVGIGSGVINYRDPSGTAGSCGTTGLIADRSEEVAGPGDGTGGTFVPCSIAVGSGQSGIWEVDFVSAVPGSGGNPPPLAATANWTQSNSNGLVSAWDITVRNSSGTPILGRVYANYYAFNIGSNGRSLSSAFTVLTREGYQYKIDLNGLDPYGFIFFSNRNGFYETSTGDSIFRSLQFVGANIGQAVPSGYAFQNPNDPDIGIYVTQKTFINPPDANMPSSANSPTGNTWLYSLPEPPPVPTNFEFTGIEGTPGKAGTNPLGGTLSFNSTSQNAFAITIDLNNDNIYGNGNDKTFVGRSVIGANSVFWDGTDGNGDSVTPSTIPYNVRINQFSGEAHFPLIDAERNNNGLIVQRLNQPPGPTSLSEDPFNIYYDDRNTGTDFTLCAAGETGVDCYGGPPNPRQALTGINSSTGEHEFFNSSGDFGDRRGIDTWVYYPSRDVELAGGIVIREADLIIDKEVALPLSNPGDTPVANPGDNVEYTITVTNDGPSDEDGMRLQDIVPATIDSVSWTCSITSGTGSCGEASGNGNTIDTTLNLENQAVATYTVTGVLSLSASGTITNSATVVRNKDITDPDLTNNTDDASIIVSMAPPPGGTLCYSVANGGDRLVGIDINTGAESNIGLVGVADIGAIAYWPATNTLYAANAGQLGTLNTSTGAYSNIGNFGTGNGNVGVEPFNDIDGLAFHPFTGELYGTVRRGAPDPQDLLIKIDPTTGAHIPNAFGTGQDYLLVQTSATTAFRDLADIAFDPETGFLYGIANNGVGTIGSFIQINTDDGTTTNIGSLGTSMEGLSAFNDGQFYGTTAGSSQQFYRIDKGSGAATQEGPDLGLGTDYESLACLVESPNRITGNVFLDEDTDAVLDGTESGTDNANVRLYRDGNGNGIVDSSDTLLSSQSTAGGGLFDFLFAANGSFVLDVDQSTLPPNNSVFTTDNVESASFGTLFNITDADNNFGHFTNSDLVIVKRITAINGVSLTDSVDDLTDGDDNHPHWPTGTTGAGISTFLAGATEKFVEPGDEVEYTIYYLATGNTPVTNVKLCDRVPTGSTYQSNSLVLFTSGSTSDLTDFADGDNGEFIASGNPTINVPCPGSNTNGTVSVNLAPSPSQLPNATGPGTPNNAYGFIRFRVTVD